MTWLQRLLAVDQNSPVQPVVTPQSGDADSKWGLSVEVLDGDGNPVTVLQSAPDAFDSDTDAILAGQALLDSPQIAEVADAPDNGKGKAA